MLFEEDYNKYSNCTQLTPFKDVPLLLVKVLFWDNSIRIPELELLVPLLLVKMLFGMNRYKFHYLYC